MREETLWNPGGKKEEERANSRGKSNSKVSTIPARTQEDGRTGRADEIRQLGAGRPMRMPGRGRTADAGCEGEC
jgi:hypothetical protein